MNTLNRSRAVIAALVVMSWSAIASPARADVKTEPTVQTVKKGSAATVAVRLLNKKTGKAVPDAVIIAKRIDMAPDAMAEMVSPLEQLPSTEPGVYRFKTNLSMEGRWQLSLGARVQGESGTVQSKLVLKAVP